MTTDPVKQAWQASVQIAGAPPLEDVRKGADKFYRLVKRRNRIEYAACAIVVPLSAWRFFTFSHPLHKAGFALLIVGVLFAAWQLHRRGSAQAPDEAGTVPILEFARGQLVRQRDALRSVFWWYLAPLIPGMVLILAGSGLDPEIERQGPPIWARWLALAVITSIFIGIWWLNQVGARKLQRRIEEIEALMDRNE